VHLTRLNALILEGPARHIFISVGVARLMRASGLFPWLPRALSKHDSPRGVWFRDGGKTVYSHLHLSNYGVFAPQTSTPPPWKT
jgi:hypothetical protein